MRRSRDFAALVGNLDLNDDEALDLIRAVCVHMSTAHGSGWWMHAWRRVWRRARAEIRCGLDDETLGREAIR